MNFAIKTMKILVNTSSITLPLMKTEYSLSLQLLHYLLISQYIVPFKDITDIDKIRGLKQRFSSTFFKDVLINVPFFLNVLINVFAYCSLISNITAISLQLTFGPNVLKLFLVTLLTP